MKEVFTQMLIPKKSVGFLPLGGKRLFLTSFLVHAQKRIVSGTIEVENSLSSNSIL